MEIYKISNSNILNQDTLVFVILYIEIHLNLIITILLINKQTCYQVSHQKLEHDLVLPQTELEYSPTFNTINLQNDSGTYQVKPMSIPIPFTSTFFSLSILFATANHTPYHWCTVHVHHQNQLPPT